MNTYDIMFIFPVTLTDEVFEKLLEQVTHEIERLNGSVARLDRMGRRPFVRPLRKRSEGLYARLWAKLGPGQVDHLLARLKLIEDVVRVQVRRLEGDVPPVVERPVAAAVREGETVSAEVSPDGQL